MKILIVEDDDGMRMLLRRYFENANCDVEEASSIDEALSRLYVGQQPHLITLDLNLGPGGELLTLQRIAELKAAAPDAVLIVLTGVVDASEESRVLKAGAHALILKSEASGSSLLSRLGTMIRGLVTSPGPNLLNLAVAEALAARFSSYINTQSNSQTQA